METVFTPGIISVKTVEEVNSVIKQYEVDTCSKFIVFKKDKKFGSNGKFSSESGLKSLSKS